MKITFAIILAITSFAAGAQVVWHNPKEEGARLHNQTLTEEARSNYYHRLPDRVEKEVRTPVWNLSKNGAGLSLKFYTNSPQIRVRYTVGEGHGFPHMPSTGKSGVDLYGYDENGDEKWYAARYNFADTINYNYSIPYPHPMHELGYEFELYLPPYNTVKWLEIGVDSSAYFKFIEPSLEKPIIAYGTSITQGACASRPGLIWTSILKRRMDAPLVNLGFSGNGRLEKSLVDIICATPSKAVIIDCMPNMAAMLDVIAQRLDSTVRAIRAAQPDVPILIADHLGMPATAKWDGLQKGVEETMKIQRATYEKLVAEGFTKLYFLSYDELAMPMDGTVEGVHPNDIGMMAYANAYEKMLRKMLYEPQGEVSSQIPRRQRREPHVYEWRERHEENMKQAREQQPDLVLIGNSITHYWGGSNRAFGSDTWEEKIAPLNVVNLGMGWDRTENVLWRIYHDALEGFSAKRIIVTLGVNNILAGRGSEVVPGMEMIIDAIRLRQPDAELVINAIYPARNREQEIAAVNIELEKLCRAKKVTYKNFGIKFLGKDGKINEKYFSDGLHPNAEGYRLIADEFIVNSALNN